MEQGLYPATTTDNAGLYRLNLLPVGTYTVEITAQGFKTTTQSNVQVGAGRDTGLGSIKVAVGETSTTVEVTGDAPLIETTQAQVSSTFSGTTLSTFAGIQENEGLDRLALFVPGVVAIPAAITSPTPTVVASPAMACAAATTIRKLTAKTTMTTA